MCYPYTIVLELGQVGGNETSYKKSVKITKHEFTFYVNVTILLLTA